MDNTSDKNTNWPGTDITTNIELVDCQQFYYYEYYPSAHAGWDRIIFNGGDGTKQTGNITFSAASNAGQYNNAGKDATGSWQNPTNPWYFAYDGDSWSTTAHPLTCTSVTSGYVELDLAANTDYAFKFVENGSTWYGCTTATKITYENKATAQTMNNTNGGSANQTIKTAVAGTYRFTWDITNKRVTVTYPDSYKITFGMGTGGATITASATSAGGSFSSGDYVGSGADVTFTQTASTGYTFAGWYTTKDAGGSVVSGMGISDNVLENVTTNKTVWSRYTENKTAITITTDGHGTITTPSPNSSPYSLGVATTQAINATASDGYHWNTWTVSGTAALGTTATTASNTVKGNGTSGGTGMVTATFTANTWYVRFNRNGGMGGSDMANESFTYDAAAKALTTNTYTRSGYEFSGWATSQANADAGTVAYADKATVRNLTTTSNGIVDLFAVWTANTYTVDFDVNGGTASPPDDKEVTFGSAYGTLPSGMTHTSKTFVGWYTDDDDGEGDLITAETIVSTASDHTLYAHYENVYSVNVNFKSGTATIYPATSVTASPTSLAPTITAPEIFGYTFTGWTGSNATFGNASSATTTVNATAATTVTANYNVVPTVYFKNNLGWDSVFVSFDIAWIEKGGKQVPSNKTKPYYKMTQIGTTDIYYCEIPSTFTSSNYASWSANIAFDNTNYGRHATSDHIGTWDFYGGEFTGRGDFDPKTTLFIPYDGDTETRNNGTFYKTGCWMKYNSTESGYQVNMNTWVTGTHDDTLTVALNAANAGGYEFSAKLNLKHADYSYGFKLYKIYQKSANDIWYTNCPATITAATDDLPWHFWAGESITATSERCALHTEALGDYTITVSFATGRPEVNVIYPASVGDWRLAYNDLAAWSDDKHDASWYLYSRVIKAAANAVDTVSFYVSKAVGASAHIELQKCTAINPSTGAETWTKQGSNLDISAITGTGIYNFKVTQNGSKVASATYLGGYEGNFYIRTDASDGGWNNYISSGKNIITYSEYAKDNSGYTHYFMRYVTKGSNIKFCIANDYSECLTEYCVSDDFTNEYIEANGNVRFMWDHRTNAVSRAYISGSSVVSDRFLVLEGDEKLFNESGQALTTAGGGKVSGLNDNEMNFIDDQNWIYEATVKAQPKAKVKLTAKYNNQIQYFYGDEGDDAADSVLLLDGTGTDKYKMRIVYDFKTNRLLRAFIPDGEISAPMAINADMMIIREHQGDAQQVTFSGEGKLSAVKTVYGAMKFNKYTVNGKEKTGGHAGTGASRYERDLFYISFPFDVKLSDAFGFGTYGKHWIIEYYDGKGRAKNGFWADSEPNWKFVWPAQRSSFTMKAFEGYILALELDEMSESSSVWDNGVEDVYVYFPSADSVKNIEATNRTITIDQEGYECKINRATPDGNRTVKDSYWHCIGVPSFANYSRPLSPTSGGETIDWSDDDGEIDWSTPNLPYLYVWNRVDNSLSVTTSATFDFKATWSYLVQYAGTSIYWSQVNVTPASIVARERTAPTNAEFRIELQQGGEKTDQTFVRLTEEENVTTGFDFNYDLSKEYNKNRANIYTMVTTVKEGDASVTQSAANVLPMSDQTTVVPVGVKIATTGDYTFAIPEGTAGVGVTLIDNETGIRTSLSALDYTINLSAGTYENRFVLEISPIKQMPTDIESVSDQHSAVRKVMVDGILYIVKDGKVFDARGAKVK